MFFNVFCMILWQACFAGFVCFRACFAYFCVHSFCFAGCLFACLLHVFSDGQENMINLRALTRVNARYLCFLLHIKYLCFLLRADVEHGLCIRVPSNKLQVLAILGMLPLAVLVTCSSWVYLHFHEVCSVQADIL